MAEGEDQGQINYDGNDIIQEARGTVYFLAPESISSGVLGGKFFSGTKYDVWTVGVSIYIMVFNRLPYTPKDTGMAEITEAILEFELDFDQGDRKISEGLQMFLYKMLEKNPKKRAAMVELKKDLWLNSFIE